MASAGGRGLGNASDDGTARLWDVDYRDTVNTLRSYLQRDFTREERLQYAIPDDGPTCSNLP